MLQCAPAGIRVKMEADRRTSLSSLTTQGDITELLNSLLADSPAGRESAGRKSLLLLPCDSCLGQDEYIQSLQQALREVLQENDVLRERVIELEAILTSIDEEIEGEDLALDSLRAQYVAERAARSL